MKIMGECPENFNDKASGSIRGSGSIRLAILTTGWFQVVLWVYLQQGGFRWYSGYTYNRVVSGGTLGILTTGWFRVVLWVYLQQGGFRWYSGYTYNRVVSGGTLGIFSICRNMHRTVVLTHWHPGGH